MGNDDAHLQGAEAGTRAINYLVTGGAGFIGSHLVEALADDDHDVTVVDAFVPNYDPALKHQNLEEVMRRAGGRARLVRCDLRNREAAFELMQDVRPEVVVHLAALAGVRPSVEDPLAYIEHNVTATVNLAEAMVRADVKKLVFASSSSVYGIDTPVPFAEEQAADRPISPYAATKRSAELLLHTYHHLYDLDVVALRLFTVYGPRQRPDLAIHRFVTRMERGLPIPRYGDGTSLRDYTHVSDVVAAIKAAAAWVRQRANVFEIINIGSGAPISLNELLAALEAATGRTAVIEQHADQPGDVSRTYASIEKARVLLGYAPERGVAASLPEFVSWWRAHLGEAARAAGSAGV